MPIYKITTPDGTQNRIVADQPFIDQHYPGAVREPDPPPEPPAPADDGYHRVWIGFDPGHDPDLSPADDAPTSTGG